MYEISQTTLLPLVRGSVHTIFPFHRHEKATWQCDFLDAQSGKFDSSGFYFQDSILQSVAVAATT